MEALIIFWSNALAACAFAALGLSRLAGGARQPGQRLLAAAFGLTACWAWLSAVTPGEPLVGYAESARNLVWIGLLYSLSAASEERQRGVSMVYSAVAAVIGMQLVADTLNLISPSGTIADTILILRVTTVAGALVLVHNLYGQAAPDSRSHIRMAMLGLALIWVYELNLYTVAYLRGASPQRLYEWRGLAVALTAPLFLFGARSGGGWRIKLSRAATFQSLSLLAICGYFALMAILATALRSSHRDWPSILLIAVLAVMTVGAMVVIPSARARGWLKLKLAKHLFEHRYDYRAEWLRFTDTLGGVGAEGPLGERIVQGFAEIVDAPGGLLVVDDPAHGPQLGAAWNWEGTLPTSDQLTAEDPLWAKCAAQGHILEIGGLGEPLPWLMKPDEAWAAIPLVHNRRMIGLVVLASPEFRRALDWEDFDLLRTAGRQAASSLAEALSREALDNAQRFEEFNRRFAFILHDIKNLVSQLSLLARNSERHADNPEFRADMVATLQSSAGKMKDLLARLAPQSSARIAACEPQPMRPILTSVVAAKRRNHEVALLGDTDVWARVDANALEQALSHLLQNAVDASAAGEPVTLRVSTQGDEVSIALIDQGCGMDADFIRQRLFQPFVSTKSGGFGIGTFEARSLIAAMNGKLTVQSRVGQGTTFTITLPAAEPVIEEQRKSA